MQKVKWPRFLLYVIILAIFVVIFFFHFIDQKFEEENLQYNIGYSDLCKKAPQIKNNEVNDGIFPGVAIEECEANNATPSKIKHCILKKGNNIDLAMLYANGVYLKQDFQKSIAYICNAYTATPRERELMVRALYDADEQGSLNKKFDYCDYVTSSNNRTACYIRSKEKEFRMLDQKFMMIGELLPVQQKADYAILLKSAFDFFDIRARNEQDLSGALRGIFITEWELEQRQWLLSVLEQLKRGEVSAKSLNNDEVKHEMQLLYKTLQQSCDACMQSDITIQGIEDTQNSFLIFRDTFAQFCLLRYPNSQIEYWHAWITQKRVMQLQSLIE